MIASFALSYFLQNLAMATMGGFAKSLNALPMLVKPITVFALRVPTSNVITIGVTVGVLIALTLFLQRTSLGVQMRAAAEDVITAQLLGVKTNRVVASAFAISGLLAGIVSLLFIGQLGLVWHGVGIEPLIVAFVAVVLGGMGSLPGAALGGFIVGVLQTSFQTALPTTLAGYRQAFVFAVVIFFLLIRPQGILPPRSAGRRA
jgi:branched-chain amino acid transport system permease protein